MITIDSNKEAITRQVAARIRQFRQMKHLSQESLALSAGMNPAFLGHIERGLKCPTVDTLNKITKALGISLSELLDFDSGIPVAGNDEAIERITLAIRRLSPEDAERIAGIVEEIVKIK